VCAIPKGDSLSDPALALAADVLDDLEKVRMANANRLGILTRTTEDSDGETRGFGLDESHPDVARLAAIVDALRKVEHDAELQLARQLRRHPLHPWIKAQKGVGEKQAARLLAAIGDPYIRHEIVKADGTVIPEGPRTVSALWAYCGLHVLPAADHDAVDALSVRVGGGATNGGDPGQSTADTQVHCAGVAPKRRRGELANWSTKAKTRAYLVATSCLKQRAATCKGDDAKTVHIDGCTCSPYRKVYDARRARTAVTHPDWTDGHSHNDALRVASKEILKDLWREAKRLHEQANSP
jgi:hypothetical protein